MSAVLLHVAVGALSVGVVLVLAFPYETVLPLLVVCVGLATGGTIYFRKSALLLCVAIISLGVGALRAQYVLDSQARETSTTYVGQHVVITGRVLGDPEIRSGHMQAVVGDIFVGKDRVTGAVLVRVPATAQLHYNDHVHISGVLREPENFFTEEGREVQYKNVLRVQGVQALMPYATMHASQQQKSILGWLYALKHRFELSLRTLLPQPDVALLEGMLLGEKGALPKEYLQAFVVSGLVHVVVLSGYNIGIVAEATLRMLWFLPNVLRLGVGGLVITLFALSVGGGAATVRALLMALIALLARYMHRPSDALRALVLVACGMVFWNPLVLLYDTSFQLSVLATFGLIVLSPWVEKQLGRLRACREFPSMRSILATTIAVECFVLPALIYTSGTVPLLSLIANLLVLPVVPWAMLWGSVAGAAGLLSPELALLPALITSVCLKWILLVVALVSSVPYSTLHLGVVSVWVYALYLPLTACVLRAHRATEASNLKARQSETRSHPS